MPGAPSLGCNFAALSAAHRCENSRVQPQEHGISQRGFDSVMLTSRTRRGGLPAPRAKAGRGGSSSVPRAPSRLFYPGMQVSYRVRRICDKANHGTRARTSRTAARARQRPTVTAWVNWSLLGSGSGLAMLVTLLTGVHPSRARVESMQTR